MSLFKITRLGLTEELELLIKFGDIDINTRERGSGDSALLVAAMENDIPIARVLIEIGKIDLNICNVMGNTALHIAADSGHDEFVKFLLSYHSIYDRKNRLDANKQNTSGYTALHLACLFQHESIVEELLKLDDTCIDVEIKTNDGETASDLATSKRDYYISNLVNQRQDTTSSAYRRITAAKAQQEESDRKWSLDLNWSAVSISAKRQNTKSTPPKIIQQRDPRRPLFGHDQHLNGTSNDNGNSGSGNSSSSSNGSSSSLNGPNSDIQNTRHRLRGLPTKATTSHLTASQRRRDREGHQQNLQHNNTQFSPYTPYDGLPDISGVLRPFPIQGSVFSMYPPQPLRTLVHPLGQVVGQLSMPFYPPPPGPPPHGPPHGTVPAGGGMSGGAMETDGLVPMSLFTPVGGPTHDLPHPSHLPAHNYFTAHPQWPTYAHPRSYPQMAHVEEKGEGHESSNGSDHDHHEGAYQGSLMLSEGQEGSPASSLFSHSRPPLTLQLPESLPSRGSVEEFKEMSDFPEHSFLHSSEVPKCHNCSNMGSNGSGDVILFKMQCCEALLSQNIHFCSTQCAVTWHKESKHGCS